MTPKPTETEFGLTPERDIDITKCIGELALRAKELGEIETHNILCLVVGVRKLRCDDKLRSAITPFAQRLMLITQLLEAAGLMQADPNAPKERT